VFLCTLYAWVGFAHLVQFPVLIFLVIEDWIQHASMETNLVIGLIAVTEELGSSSR